MGGFPPNLRSHCAAHMQIWDFFVSASLRSATDYRVPSSPTYRYMPRKNSGIRGLSLRTEGAFGNAVFEGHIRYPHGPKALYNRRIGILFSKKISKICICAKFVVPLHQICI